jgi:hypothetical protein
MTALNFWTSAAAVVALAALWPLSALAQTAQDPHHPTEPTTAQSSAPATAPLAAAPTSGMGPSGMVGGMYGPQGMMSMMNMAHMMAMVGQTGPGTMGAMQCEVGMGTIDHVEGWLAFLRTELKITDAQSQVWNEFGDAIRMNAEKLGEVRKTIMMPQTTGGQMWAPTLVQKLDYQERWLTARLEGIRAIKTTYDHLYGALSDEQKKAAEGLLAPHVGVGTLGMMPMSGSQP